MTRQKKTFLFSALEDPSYKRVPRVDIYAQLTSSYENHFETLKL